MAPEDRCPQCAALADGSSDRCPRCRAALLVPSLAFAAALDAPALQRYIEAYESRVVCAPADGRTWLALGLCRLHMRAFDRAVAAFEKAAECDPGDPDALYYGALARAAGRSPGTIPAAEIERILEDIDAACESGPFDAKYFAAAAAIRADHHQAKGRAVPDPSAEELLGEALRGRAEPGEIRRLLEFLPVRDARIRNALREMSGEGVEAAPLNPRRDPSRSRRIQEWFDVPKPVFPWLVAGAATVIALMAVATWIRERPTATAWLRNMAIVLGGGGLAGYVWQRRRYRRRPDAEEMMQWFREDFDAVQARAAAAVGLDPRAMRGEPAGLLGLVRANQALAAGLDETTHRSVADNGNPPFLHPYWDCLVLVFGPDRLILHRALYNWHRHVVLNDRIDEYFYQHVVSVKTVTESSLAEDGKAEERARYFVLSFASGERTRLQVMDRGVRPFNEAEMIALADQAVERIRAVIQSTGLIGPRS